MSLLQQFSIDPSDRHRSLEEIFAVPPDAKFASRKEYDTVRQAAVFDAKAKEQEAEQ
jgi:hypothetical protein